MQTSRRSGGILAVLVLAVCVPTIAGAQGFGVIKKSVILSRALPPVVDLSGSKVAIKVTAVAGSGYAVAQPLQAKLTALVFSNNTLVESANAPDAVIEVGVTDFASRTKYEQDRSQTVTATLRAAYRTVNNRTRQSLDARNLAVDFARNYPAAAQPTTQTGKGFVGTLNKITNSLGRSTAADSSSQPPTSEQLTMMMVEALAVQIAQRVVLTRESIEVPLPRGKLDKASDLAVAGRWGAMLEELEQMAPLPAADEAYRQYGIGVANEALAYGEEDPAKQRDLVANASHNFKAALELHPSEKIFQKAGNRIAESEAALAVASAQSETAARQIAARTPTNDASKKTRWDNAAVIELVRAGFTDTELVEAVRTAPNASFDIATPAGLIELRRAGISDVVIRAMRMRMQQADRSDRDESPPPAA